MASPVAHLLSLRDEPGRFSHRPSDLLPVQLEAVNERLESQVGSIPLLANRLQAAGLQSVAKPEDLVPLLFAHNTYKTYAESWLVEGQWGRMARWLATVTTYEAPADESFEGVSGSDQSSASFWSTSSSSRPSTRP